MQGRLSPLMDGRIQAFPWPCWRDEFKHAEAIGIHLMEWTLDQERLAENPLLTPAGQGEIRSLCERYGFAIPSLTGDCFMQAPFWKARGGAREQLHADFESITRACGATGICFIVVPLVDNGRLENMRQEQDLIGYLQDQTDLFASEGVKILFESDFAPDQLSLFIERLDPAYFGINYDIGNSAALGFLPRDEFSAYGERIMNVHIKDRPLGGTTVPLGSGDADFSEVFSGLAALGYHGNYILQTARAADDDHAGLLSRFFSMSREWIDHYGS